MGILERLGDIVGLSPDQAIRGLATLTVLVVWLVVLRVGRRIVAKTVDDSASRFHMARVLGYAVGGFALLVLARLWIQGIAGVGTYLGLLSAGLAIALQDPLTNLAGWLYIILRRPFRVGDRVQVGTQAGDVVDIRPFRFIMLEIGNWVNADQSTGRVLHVPNALVFKHAVANYDEAFGYIWNELEVTVSFESDWKRAKTTLEAIVQAQADSLDGEVRRRIDLAAETMHIKFTKLTPVVWTSVRDHGVSLTMRYLCKPRERRSSSSAIWEKILEAFSQMPDVDFAYPTVRKFDHAAEGKAGVRSHETAASSMKR